MPTPSAGQLAFATIDQIVTQARHSLSAGALASIERGGTGGGVTTTRNRQAFRELALVPRVLRDVGEVAADTTFLGVPIALPVMLAPVGNLHEYHAEGAIAAGCGAMDGGTRAFVAMRSEASFESVVEQAGNAHIPQLFAGGDRGWLRALIERFVAAGARAVCVTVDIPVRPRSDGLLELGIQRDVHTTQAATPANLVGFGRDRAYQAQFCWPDLEWLVSISELPVIVKGIMHPADGRRAAELGVASIVVSNHGGRGLDDCVSTVEMLPLVVDAVGPGVEVILDGGIMRGTDVCKAVALGARAVLVGKLECWALAAGGREGVTQALELLREEIRLTLGLLGSCSPAELTREHVRPTFAV